jgi:MGT family glycosyltransferase
MKFSGSRCFFVGLRWPIKISLTLDPVSNNSETMTIKRKILFANIPGQGHFNPLTCLAVYLKNQGHDVRWYAGRIHHKKLQQLSIPFFPFSKARDIDPGELDELFSERKKMSNLVKKLKFDLRNVFILRSKEFYEDIKEIDKSFPFDLLICDISFTGLPFVKEKMGRPVFSIGIFPIMETSKDLPPYGLAMLPSQSLFGKLKQKFFKFLADRVLFKESHDHFRSILKQHGIPTTNKNIFDLAYEMSTLVLQNGTPGLDYKRSDLSKNIRFIGPMFPAGNVARSNTSMLAERLKRFKKVILVTQGTVEKNVNKIIVPTIEAFRNTDNMLVVTTGGGQTQEMRNLYAADNVLIEDFIPFDDIMPYCDVYITNGGYGGVMYGIKNKLPLVVAGIHEGKNEINARIGYLGLGINLETENPKPEQIRKATEKILSNSSYKKNVIALSEEFQRYEPGPLCEKYMVEILDAK